MMESPCVMGATSQVSECDEEGLAENSKSQVNLSIGLDVSDDCILREGPPLCNLSVSPIFERKLLSQASFKLTPVLQDYRKEISEASDSKEGKTLDLTTPQQGVTFNHGTSCPERPVKGHKSVLPSAEKSCRLLFTQESLHSTLERDLKSGKQNKLVQPREKFWESDAPCEKGESLPQTPGKLREEEHQSTSSCAPSSSCSKSSCDVTTCSSSPCLSSPNLSEIRGAKRTIESSLSDIEDLLNGDFDTHASVFEDQQCEIITREDDAPQQGDVNNQAAGDDQQCKIQGQVNDDVFLGPSLSQKPQVDNDTANKIISIAASSADGTPSNWTLVSGVSPLPLSDPSHLQQYYMHKGHHHHHHHHHHRHHHHHHQHHHHQHYQHHHHHHCHQNNQERNGIKGSSNIVKSPEKLEGDRLMLTSTPIRLKAVDNLDVSSIKTRKSLGEVIGDFVISSDLRESDISFSGSDTRAKENVFTPILTYNDNEDEQNFDGNPEHKGCETTKTRAHYHWSDDEPSDKKLKLPGADSESSDFGKKFAGRTPHTRRLTKEEVELLRSTPENFSDDIWYSNSGPISCLSEEF